MAWLPDTNAWIQVLKQPGGPVEQNMLRHTPDEILLCSVVKAELWHGAYKYGRADRRLRVLESLFAGFVSLPFDADFRGGKFDDNLRRSGVYKFEAAITEPGDL